MSQLVFLGLVIVIGIMDYRRRAIIRLVPIIGLVLAYAWSDQWSLLGILIGAAIPTLAGLPAGDVWVGAMLGAWVGMAGIAFVWSGALSFGVTLWFLYRLHFIGWPGDYPFAPFVLAPAVLFHLWNYKI